MKKISVDEHAQFKAERTYYESDRMLIEFKMMKMIFIKYREKEEGSSSFNRVFLSFHHLTAT